MDYKKDYKMSINKDYANFFETINKDTKLDSYKNYFHEKSRFKDPFNDVVGVDNIYNIFVSMYKQVDNPSFKILENISSNEISYIKWEFTFNFKNSTKKEMFIGVSRVEFDENNKVLFHEDFWDTSENLYEKIPILSSIMKFIKKRLQH